MGMSSGGGGGMSDINVTPLVDVMLVLLIIFMVTAPMLNQGVNIELPDEVAEQPPDETEKDELFLTVGKDLTTTLRRGKTDAVPMEPAEIIVELERIALDNPEIPVFLEAHGTVPYKKVAFLLAAAQTAGLPKIGMVFDPFEDEGEP